MTDWGEVATIACTTLVIIVLIATFGFGFWTDYQIQKEHLEIERAKIQCQQCLEERQ